MNKTDDVEYFIERLIQTSDITGKLHFATVFYEIYNKPVNTMGKDHNRDFINKVATKMHHEYKYTEKDTKDFFGYALNDEGKKARKAGGHFTYHAELKRVSERSEGITEYDFLNKEWYYKYRWVPFIISGLALLVSSIALTFAIKAFYKPLPKQPETSKEKKMTLPTTSINALSQN